MIGAEPERLPAVPVLLYHSVREEPTPGYEAWETSPARLRMQLEQLAEFGRAVVPLDRYARRLRGEQVVLPDHPVVLTFDDGFANFLDVVPDLLERGCPVTMFVPTSYVGGDSSWLAPQFRRPMLTWSQIVDLDRSGVEIGAHAHVHRPIDTLSRREQLEEITRSRALIEDHLGHACAAFAYPHGYYSRRLGRMLVAAGFTRGCAVKDAMSGAGDDPMAIARLFVGWDDVGQRFDDLVVAGHRRRARHERLTTRGWRVARRMKELRARRKATHPVRPS